MKIWVGREVEATPQYSRETVFWGDMPSCLPSNLWFYQNHFFNEQFWLEHGFAMVEEALRNRCNVTLSASPENVEKIPAVYRSLCHIMVFINAPWMALMKKTDSVRLDISEYNNVSFYVGSGIRALPVDYQLDRSLED